MEKRVSRLTEKWTLNRARPEARVALKMNVRFTGGPALYVFE